MGCPSSVEIGHTLTFSITCHDPDTGILSDSDAPPQYRLYKDETATPILTGTMAKLDDANTTGFYTENITCSAGNGFEDGKTYTIYIEATVDSDTGGICYAFKTVTKTGYALSATGLDAIATTAPTGVATTFREMVVATWRRFFKKATKSSTQLKTYADDGTTVVTTQTIADTGTVETQGAAE